MKEQVRGAIMNGLDNGRTILLVAAGLAGYQYRLIRRRGREGCFKAFLNNNWLGFAIFAGLALDLYVRVRLRW